MITEEEIYQGIFNRDREVISYCYTKYLPVVQNWIMKNGGRKEEAEDIFQDGMVALFLNIKSGKYRQTGTKVMTYLMQICKYKWIDRLKSSQKQKLTPIGEMDFENKETSIVEDLEALHAQKQIELALKELDEKCRKIIQFFYWEQKSMETIARELQMVTASVKNGKYRCMKKLKEIFSTMPAINEDF